MGEGVRTHRKAVATERVELADLGLAAPRAGGVEHVGGHVRLDEAGADGVDPDVEPLELVASGERNAVHAAG